VLVVRLPVTLAVAAVGILFLLAAILEPTVLAVQVATALLALEAAVLAL
jgi:hypothetical protein